MFSIKLHFIRESQSQLPQNIPGLLFNEFPLRYICIQLFIMATEKLCIKWNDFQDLIQASFEELRSDNDFTDVTLACEDQSIKAHKVILSACSPFFKNLLKAHPNPQPLIYMRGVKTSDLVAVVDFIYRGEANIYQDQLESFLALAEELELKGLSASSKDESVKEEFAKEYFDNRQHRTDYTQKGMDEGQHFKYEVQTNAMMPIIRTRPKQTPLIDPLIMARIESMIERHNDGSFSCVKCDFKAKKKGHMKEHTEKHIEGLEYPCNSCNKVFRSSQSLRDHKRKYHNLIL